MDDIFERIAARYSQSWHSPLNMTSCLRHTCFQGATFFGVSAGMMLKICSLAHIALFLSTLEQHMSRFRERFQRDGGRLARNRGVPSGSRVDTPRSCTTTARKATRIHHNDTLNDACAQDAEGNNSDAEHEGPRSHGCSHRTYFGPSWLTLFGRMHHNAAWRTKQNIPSQEVCDSHHAT